MSETDDQDKRQRNGPAPLPVTLIVPGWSDDSRRLSPCRDHLIAAGWPPDRVACLSFRDRYGGNVDHAHEIGAAVEGLRERSGAARVAVVAHSMGGLALHYYLTALGGAAAVHTAIFLATPHRGTWLAWLARGRGGAEMRPGSPLLRRLARAPLPPGVRAICIRSRFDTRIVPGSGTRLDGAECHTVRLPMHARLLRHRATLRLIAGLLRDSGDPAAGPAGDDAADHPGR
jgi:pimeloyl-ACP methyl ester carboxylesterase